MWSAFYLILQDISISREVKRFCKCNLDYIKMDFQTFSIPAILCNSVVIEMYGDTIQVSHGFEDCQMLAFADSKTLPISFSDMKIQKNFNAFGSIETRYDDIIFPLLQKFSHVKLP